MSAARLAAHDTAISTTTDVVNCGGYDAVVLLPVTPVVAAAVAVTLAVVGLIGGNSWMISCFGG